MSDHRASFDAATPKFYPGEVEFEIEWHDGDLTLSLPAEDGEVVPGAVEAARSMLVHLEALNIEAMRYLQALPNWPYADDLLLWLLLVQPDNVRFCYRQARVNDEQVIGFRREEDSWRLQGPDPRFRG